MPVLRALLVSTVLVSVASAQPAVQPASPGPPGGLTRNGGVVMMQPIPDGSSEGESLPGPRPTSLHVLAPADHDLYVRAFDAAGRRDWTTARALAAQGQNLLARRLLEWRYALDKDSGASFAEIDAVIKDAAAPGRLRGTLQARAEAAMDPNMPPAQVIAWFAGKTPNSAIGHIRFGEALVATGEKARGGREIARGWAEGSFDPPVEQAILEKDASYLTPESDRARMDALLWRGETTAARRQLARVDPATQEIANARIVLYASGWPKAQAVMEKLRDTSDPALMFDWSRALRLADRDKEAHAVLLRIEPASLIKEHAARWWNESSVAGARCPGRHRARPGAGARAACRLHLGRPLCRSAIPRRLHRPALPQGPCRRARRLPAAGSRRRPPHQQVPRLLLGRPRLRSRRPDCGSACAAIAWRRPIPKPSMARWPWPIPTPRPPCI